MHPCGPNLGKSLACFASIYSSHDQIARVLRLDLLFAPPPPPAEPKGTRSAGLIGVRGSATPASLARQVGGVEVV